MVRREIFFVRTGAYDLETERLNGIGVEQMTNAAEWLASVLSKESTLVLGTVALPAALESAEIIHKTLTANEVPCHLATHNEIATLGLFPERTPDLDGALERILEDVADADGPPANLAVVTSRHLLQATLTLKSDSSYRAKLDCTSILHKPIITGGSIVEYVPGTWPYLHFAYTANFTAVD